MNSPPNSPCVACPHKGKGVCGALGMGLPGSSLPISQSEFRARNIICKPRQPETRLAILCEGLALKFYGLIDGQRQILSLRRPGFFVLGGSAFAEGTSFSAMALTDARVALVSRSEVLARIASVPSIVTRLAGIFDIDHTDVAELAVDLGRRDAEQRISHLLLKLALWLQAPVNDNACTMKAIFRQEDIADFTGLTTAHVNRTLGNMRRAKLIATDGGEIKLLDMEKLRLAVG